MSLGSADHYSVLPSIHDMNIGIRVFLFTGRQAAIPLGVGHGP